jgi:AcrR family transcriptional regulator
VIRSICATYAKILCIFKQGQPPLALKKVSVEFAEGPTFMATVKKNSQSAATKKVETAKKVRSKSAPTLIADSQSMVVGSMRDEVVAYRKDLILRAARDTFFEHGYHDCSVDMVAQRLSGTKAIVYYYFPDKHSILVEIYRRALIEAQELMGKAIAEHSDPKERLAAIARNYTRWVIDNQRVVGIYWREFQSLSDEARQEVALGQKKMDDLLAGAIRAGVEQGHFDVADVRATARAIEGMITFTYTWWRDDKRLSREDAVEHYAQMALRMVCPAQN